MVDSQGTTNTPVAGIAPDFQGGQYPGRGVREPLRNEAPGDDSILVDRPS
jgi:hypothetical protein